MQTLCRKIFPDRIKKYPAKRNSALAEFKTALTVGSKERGIKERRQEISGRSIKIKNTHRMNGVKAMTPSVRRSNFRCMK